MRYRRLASGDLTGLLALQDANLHDVLDENRRGDGFLSVRFSEAQLLQMAQEVAVIVAHDGDDIAGYLCASGNDYNERFPLLANMLAHASPLMSLGRPLSRQRTFVYGPACVAQSRRRSGVLRGMVGRLRDELAGDYDAGVLFIAKGNAASLHAHDAVGASIVGEFVHEGRAFWILALPIPQPRCC